MLLGLLVVGTLGALLLTHLEWLRAPLRAWVLGRTGLSLDFACASLLPWRLRVRGARLAGHERLRDTTPDVIVVDELDVRFSPGAALEGRFASVQVRGVHLAHRSDERGSSWPLPPSPPSATPGPALSQLLARLAPLPVRVDAIVVDDIEARWHSGVGADAIELRASGFGLRGQLGEALQLAALERPLRLELVVGEAQRVLVLRPTLRAELRSGGQGSVGLALEYESSSGLFRRPPPNPLVDLRAELSVDAATHRTRIVTRGARVLGAGATLDAELWLGDGPPVQPRLGAFDLTIELAPLVAAIPDVVFDERSGTGTLKLHGRDLELGPRGLPLPGARLTIEGAVRDVRLRRPNFGLRLDRSSIKGELRLDEAGRPFLSLELPFLELVLEHESGRHHFARGRAHVELQPRSLKALWPVVAHAEVDLDDSRSQILDQTLFADGLRLELRGQTEHRQARAELQLTARRVHYVVPGVVDVDNRGVKLRLQSSSLYLGHGFLRKLTDAALDVDVERGSIAGRSHGQRVRFGPQPLHLTSTVRDLVLHHEEWLDARGTLHFDGALGGVALKLDAARLQREQLDYEITVDAKQLGALRPLLDPRFPFVDWERPGVHLHSKGKVGNAHRLSALTLTQTGELQIAPFGVAGWSADELRIALGSSGDRTQQSFDLQIKTRALRRSSEVLADQSLLLRGKVDLRQPSLALVLNGQGALGPTGMLAIDVRLDRQARLIGRVDGGLHNLQLVDGLLKALARPSSSGAPAPLDAPPLLTSVDWQRLSIAPHAVFTLDKLVERKHGQWQLVDRVWQAARGQADLGLGLDGLRLRVGARRLAAKQLKLALQADLGAEVATAKATLEGSGLSLVDGDRAVDVTSAKLTADAQRRGALLELSLRAEAAEARQDFWPGYPVSGLKVALTLKGDPAATLHLHEGVLDNPGGGTHLAVTGSLEEGGPSASWDSVPGRRGLHLEGTLEQTLAKLPAPFEQAGTRGVVRIPFEVQSSDRRLYRVQARPRFAAVGFRLQSPRLEVSGLDGELLITQELLLDERGLTRLGGGGRAAPLRLRFAEALPLLSEASYFHLDSLRLGDHRLGPLAGNLQIDRNLLALDQLEASAFDGTLRGQLLLDLAGARSQALLRLDATGLRASDGARFDGAVALQAHAEEERLDGRVEITSLGRQHLFDLLGALDPGGSDPSLGRLRGLFKLVHPRRLTLRMADGLGNLQLELGGLGRLVHIEEIRGLSLGPLWRRYLAPLFDAFAEDTTANAPSTPGQAP